MNPLADALGQQALIELAQRAGGMSLRIPTMSAHPRAVAARKRLVALVGVRFAEDLITHFARTRVYIPNGGAPCDSSTGQRIDHRVVARLTKRGKTASQIADRLGCSMRTVYAKRAKARTSRKGKRP